MVPQNMSGIDPNFICHCLSLRPSVKLVARRKRKYGEEKMAAIKEKNDKLTGPSSWMPTQGKLKFV